MKINGASGDLIVNRGDLLQGQDGEYRVAEFGDKVYLCCQKTAKCYPIREKEHEMLHFIETPIPDRGQALNPPPPEHDESVRNFVRNVNAKIRKAEGLQKANLIYIRDQVLKTGKITIRRLRDVQG
jgi:hypothetical protein